MYTHQLGRVGRTLQGTSSTPFFFGGRGRGEEGEEGEEEGEDLPPPKLEIKCCPRNFFLLSNESGILFNLKENYTLKSSLSYLKEHLK